MLSRSSTAHLCDCASVASSVPNNAIETQRQPSGAELLDVLRRSAFSAQIERVFRRYATRQPIVTNTGKPPATFHEQGESARASTAARFGPAAYACIAWRTCTCTDPLSAAARVFVSATLQRIGAGLSSSYLREPDWFKLISDLFPALLPHEHLALIFRHATARSAGPRIEPTAEFGNDLGNPLAARAMSFERSARASGPSARPFYATQSGVQATGHSAGSSRAIHGNSDPSAAARARSTWLLHAASSLRACALPSSSSILPPTPRPSRALHAARTSVTRALCARTSSESCG